MPGRQPGDGPCRRSVAGDPGQVQVSRMAMFLSRGDLVLLRAAASIRPGSRARSSCFGRRNRKTPFAPASMPLPQAITASTAIAVTYH